MAVARTDNVQVLLITKLSANKSSTISLFSIHAARGKLRGSSFTASWTESWILRPLITGWIRLQQEAAQKAMGATRHEAACKAKQG